MIYIVTNTELGWDCVVGAFSDKEYVESVYGSNGRDSRYVITPTSISNTKLAKTKSGATIDESLKKHGRKETSYAEITDKEADSMFMIMDACYITVGKYHDAHNKELMSLVLDNFKQVCDDNGLNPGNLYLAQINGKHYLVCDAWKCVDDWDDVVENGLTGNNIVCELFEAQLKKNNIEYN